VSIAEVMGMREGEIVLQELFAFRQLGVSTDGRAVGYHTATGSKSVFLQHFRTEGIEIPDSMFAPTPQPSVESFA
jgi:pilus assembly protein CpaF